MCSYNINLISVFLSMLKYISQSLFLRFGKTFHYAVALPQMHLTFTVVDVDSPTVTAAQSTATTSFDSSSTTASGATANNNGSSSSTSANASSLPRGSLVLSTLEDFLQDFLKQSASQHRDALVRVDLNVTDWQDEATTTPNLNGSRVWAVDCQGQAVFVAAANASSDASAATTTDTSTTSTTPTSDDLTKAIITYFSFWGLSELQTYLYEHAQWTVASVSVAVNGDVVQPASGTTGGGDGTDDANDSGPSSSQDAAAAASATHKRNVAIAAVVSVVAVLLVAGALWIVVRRRCQGRRKSSTTDRHNNHNKRIDLDSDHGYGADGYIDNDDDDGLTHESHSPQHSHDVGNRYDYSPPFKSLNPNLPLRIVGPASGSPSRDSTGSTTPPFAAIPDDLMSYSGIVSVEDSVFTSAAGTSASNSPDRPFAYDARRLDHVILSARGFTERHEREELQQQQQQEQSLQRQRSVGGSTAPGDAASAATSI